MADAAQGADAPPNPVVENVDMNVAKEVKKEKESDIPRINIARFFDIIGQLDIILKSDTSVRIVATAYPFEGVSAGEFELSTIDAIPVMFKVFDAGDDKRPWIMTDFPCITPFSSFDDYISSVWKMMMIKLDYSKNVLVCPRSSVWVNRQPEPSKLGYPTDLILEVNARVHDIIQNIIQNINVRDRTPTLVDLTVCGDPTILRISNNLINYSEINVPAIRNITQRMLDLSSGNASASEILTRNSITTHFHPIFDFRYAGLLFSQLPYYVRLSYDATIHAIAPEIPISPVSDAVIVKMGQTSATRSGFLPDIIATEYSPSMSTDFAVIVSTLLAPGQIQVDIDWSDCPTEATEFTGFIALVAKALFMRSNTPLDSITDESARRVEERIVTLGLKNNLFARRAVVNPNVYPLENVDVTRMLRPGILDHMRTDLTGRGWMNANRQVREEDGFDDIYHTMMERRPIYAINCSDYDEFEFRENEFTGTWNIYVALESFSLAWGRKNSTISEAFLIYLKNILRFLVRLNEYNRKNYYTGLRLPWDILLRLVGEEKERQALRVPIKAKSIIAFAKSIGHNLPYMRRVSFHQQMKVETKTVETMCIIRALFRLIESEVIHYGIQGEYGKQKIWSICINAIDSSSCPFAAHLYNLKDRRVLSNLPRTYCQGVEESALFAGVYPILLESIERNPAQVGLLRDFFYSSTNNRINTIQNLETLAVNGSVLINRIEDFSPGPFADITFPQPIRGWLRQCAVKFMLDISSTERFVHMVSPLKINLSLDSLGNDQALPIKFSYPDTNRRISDCLTFSQYNFGILRITTNEIRRPDHVVNLAVSKQCIAARSADIADAVMPLDDFVARIGEFTHRVTIFRDASATFISSLQLLPI